MNPSSDSTFHLAICFLLFLELRPYRIGNFVLYHDITPAVQTNSRYFIEGRGYVFTTISIFSSLGNNSILNQQKGKSKLKKIQFI